MSTTAHTSSPGPTVIEGLLDAKGLRFAIVVARFNHLVTDRLLEGALDTLRRHGVDLDSVVVVRVPGSFEIPQAASRLARAGGYNAVVCLGALIRGATPHFDYIAAETSKGIGQVALDSGVPITFGVLTTDTLDQAFERAGTKAGNKGADAALAAIEMANLFGHLDPQGR